MVKSDVIKALQVIDQLLKDTHVQWCLIASSSLALQGINVEPNDIDILTDKQGAFEIDCRLKDYVIKPVVFNDLQERFRAYFGEFQINGVEVEVMADMIEKIKQVTDHF